MVNLSEYIQEKNIVSEIILTEERTTLKNKLDNAKDRWNNSLLGSFFKWLFGEETKDKYDLANSKYDATEKTTYIKNSEEKPEVKLLNEEQVKEILKKEGAANTDPKVNPFNKVHTFIHDSNNSSILKKDEGQWAGWHFGSKDINEFYILAYFYREESTMYVPLFVVKEAKAYASKTDYSLIAVWLRRKDSRILELSINDKHAKDLWKELEKLKDGKLKEDKANKAHIYQYVS